ncbi:MAG: WG repeat-containing protein [Cyanobacteria bacterium TGS_CYA1]|nr:WG repeat-containing protein [Cyanobacteria bacterium TGS_CYA1]
MRSKGIKASLITSALCIVSLSIQCVMAQPTQPFADQVVVDEEMRNPEGSCHASSTIYERAGDDYKSTNRTISKSVIDEIRRTAIASESKILPDLKDFGITKESVEENKNKLVQAAYTKYGRTKPEKTITWESLAPELKYLFEYDTVSKNALDTVTGSMNSAYDFVRFYLPGEPPIILQSRHRQSGMLPWTVKLGEKTWNTYSRDLPVALSKIASPSSAHYLADDKPDFRFQRMGNKATKFWPEGFFAQYGTWSNDLVESFEAIQDSKKLPGFEVASKIMSVEDAIKYDYDGKYDFLIQVRITKPDCVIDRLRVKLEAPTKEEDQNLHNWNDILNWYNQIELSVQSLNWLKKWKAENPNRSILAMKTNSSDPSFEDREGLNNLWKHSNLADKPKYYFRLLENGRHARDLFIGTTFDASIVSDLGPFGGPNARLPKVMQSKSESILRNHENGHDELGERLWAVLDKNGKILNKSEFPASYAIPGGAPFPVATDPEYNYSWPVDFLKMEDIEYLFSKSDDDEKIESAMPRDFEQKALWGLIDKSGKIVLNQEFKSIKAFSDGLAPIQNNSNKYGFINQEGKIVIPTEYEDAEPFHEGLASVKKDGKWGFIDTSGKIMVPFNFDSVHQFSEGLAPVRSGTKFGYIDKTGVYVIKPQFGRARHFKNGLAYVQIDGKRAYINKTGNPIGGNYYDRLERFSNDLALFASGDKIGFIDLQGNQVIPAKFSDADSFRNGIAVVAVGESRKAINTKGEFVNPPAPHSDFWDGPLKDGLVRITKEEKCDRKYGFSDKSGKVIIKPIYDQVGIFENDLCPVQVDGKFGVIDKTSKIVIPIKYMHLAQSFSEKRIAFYEKSRCGILDDTGKVIVEPSYDKISAFENGIAITQNGIKYGYIDANGKVIFEPKFDVANKFGALGLAMVGTRVNKLEDVRLP